jgi:gluconate 5-dehydrogenase
VSTTTSTAAEAASLSASAPAPSSGWLGLSGRRVFVAGAGGIGAACVEAFLDAGAQVAVADVSAAALESLPPTVARLQADLASAAGCREAVTQALSSLGGLDAFVHAVGVNHRVPVLDVDDETWLRVLDVNLSSAFWLGREAGRHMVAAGRGRQVYLSSVSGLLAHPDHSAYAATKGGLNQLLRVMAREWAPHGVTVNGIGPGYTETELTRAHLDKPGMREHYTALVPAGRLGGVDDLAGPVLFLCSDRASFVTGQVLYVDGGRTLV